jgi:putative thioredoxin
MEIDVNDENFEKEVIEKSKEIPVLVDFWAEWCGPCVMLKPILEKISKDYQGKIILANLDVHENRQISSKFDVMSIPSVKLFKKGKIVDEFVGVQPEQKIREWLEMKL